MGDFYQGDFYQGDPGFFSFLGRAAKGLVGMIPGVGGVAQKALGAGGAMRASGRVLQAARGGAAAIAKITAKHPVLSAAGAAGAVGIGAGALAGRGMGPSGMPGRGGYHIEKKGKHAGEWIKNRRMRVTNPRALRRAIRRATGFAHLAKRVLRFTSPRAPRGRAVFKARRRTKRV